MQQILCNQIKACPDIGFRALSFALHFPAILNLPNIQVEQGRKLLKASKYTLSHDLSHGISTFCDQALWYFETWKNFTGKTLPHIDCLWPIKILSVWSKHDIIQFRKDVIYATIYALSNLYNQQM